MEGIETLGNEAGIAREGPFKDNPIVIPPDLGASANRVLELFKLENPFIDDFVELLNEDEADFMPCLRKFAIIFFVLPYPILLTCVTSQNSKTFENEQNEIDWKNNTRCSNCGFTNS